MKESTYGPLFEQAVKEAGEEGISAGDLYELVGSSRQAVYGWIKSNQTNLAEAGMSDRRGVKYRWIERAPTVRGNGAGIEVGTTFTVSRMRFINGHAVATLAGPGIEVEMPLS